MALNWLRYANQGATRNQPLNAQLINALSFLPELGISMEVFSGGQDESGPRRTGSHRHDLGGAGDVFFYKDGRKLDWANPQDVPIFQEIVKQAHARGVTGFGAGEGYMRPGSMHIGFGAPSVWGAGGAGANAPDWLVQAYGGTPASTTAMLNKAGSNNQAVGSAGADQLNLTPQQRWMQGLWQYAQAASQKTGVDPRLIMAQAALETGYGKSAPNNNYFGIKGPGEGQKTLEFINGKMQPTTASFRTYKDPAESFDAYANFMMGDRYAGVRGGKTLEEQVAALGKSGYATDPDYAAKILKIAQGMPQGGYGTAAIADTTGGAAGGGGSASPYALPQKKTDKKAKIGAAFADAFAAMGGGGGNIPQPDSTPEPEAARVDAPVVSLWDDQKAEANRQRLAMIMQALNQNTLGGG